MDRAHDRHARQALALGEGPPDGLAWLTFDKQGESTNTFSREALQELGAALDAIAAAKPKGLVIRSAKENFIAGADIKEFTRFANAQEALAFNRLGWDTLQKLRDLPFPTTAMVNGFCMGGGLELALACTYRVALDDPKTRFAFPEVMLGIWPSWHGLQWLPKLVGRVGGARHDPHRPRSGRAAREEDRPRHRSGAACACSRTQRAHGDAGGTSAAQAPPAWTA